MIRYVFAEMMRVGIADVLLDTLGSGRKRPHYKGASRLIRSIPAHEDHKGLGTITDRPLIVTVLFSVAASNCSRRKLHQKSGRQGKGNGARHSFTE